MITIDEAIKKQQKIIKDTRGKMVNEFYLLSNKEINGLKNRIELAQTRIKNFKNGTLSPYDFN